MSDRHAKMVAAAVWLSQHGALIGWGLVSDGKAVNRHWKSDLTDDEAVIRRNLSGGRNSLIVPTGRLVGLDLDKHGWHQRVLDAGLPPTYTVQTPTERTDPATGETFHGVHAYTLAPEGFDVTTLPGTITGGEIRRSVAGEQSMVLGPWALRPDGVYTPLRGTPRTLAVLPQSVIDLLIASRVQKPRQPASGGDWTWDGSMGSRHDHLRDRVRHWVGEGIRGDTLRSLVRDHMTRHAIPEVSDDGRRMDADEIEALCVGAEVKFNDDAPAITLFGARNGQVAATGEAVPTTDLIMPLGDFLSEQDASPEWLVENVIPREAEVLFLGKKESFKSTAAQWLMVCAAAERSWLGKTVTGMSGVYVSNEKRRRSIRVRFARMTDGLTLVHDIGVVHRRGLTLDAGNPAWQTFVREIEARQRPTLVVLDTLASLAPPGFKENSPEAMSGVLAAVRMLLALSTPVTVILAHHPSKSDDGGVETSARGHSSLDGEVDGSLIFLRPDRRKNAGSIHARPKDGPYTLMLFEWDEATMRLTPPGIQLSGVPLTVSLAVGIVAQMGGRASVDDVQQVIGDRFSRRRVQQVMKSALGDGLLLREGGTGGKPAVFVTVSEGSDFVSVSSAAEEGLGLDFVSASPASEMEG